MSGRNIRACDLVQLWARAAGMCSHPDCKRRLVLDGSGADEPASIGQAAHIVARKEKGPRGSAPLAAARLDAYDNLILLCANHHTIADKQPGAHPVESLRAWKAEHEAWVEAATAITPRDLPWTAILQDPDRRIDEVEARSALPPGHCAEDTVELRGDAPRGAWEETAAREWRAVEGLITRTPPERRRFAVFSLGRAPLAVQLGYVLGDRARVALFQYDRDRGTWRWDETAPPAGPLSIDTAGAGEEAVIRVSLSAAIRPADGVRAGVEIDIRVPVPSTRWLRRPEQLPELARVYEQALTEIRERGCRRVHLLYAGPAPGAVQFGRSYNPRMNPPLHVYDYRRQASPCYEPALVLNR